MKGKRTMKKVLIIFLSFITVITLASVTKSFAGIFDLGDGDDDGGGSTPSDTTPPNITVPYSTITLESGVDVFSAPECSAYDSKDGVVSCSMYYNDVDTRVRGTYYVKYKAYDYSGNKRVKTINVIVENTRVPDHHRPDYCSYTPLDEMDDFMRDSCINFDTLYQNFSYNDVEVLDNEIKAYVGASEIRNSCSTISFNYEKVGEQQELVGDTAEFVDSKRYDFDSPDGRYTYIFKTGINPLSYNDDYHLIYENFEICQEVILLDKGVDLNENFENKIITREYIEDGSSFICRENADTNNDGIIEPLCSISVKQTFIPTKIYYKSLLTTTMDELAKLGITIESFTQLYGAFTIENAMKFISWTVTSKIAAGFFAGKTIAALSTIVPPLAVLTGISIFTYTISSGIDYLLFELPHQNAIVDMLDNVNNYIEDVCDGEIISDPYSDTIIVNVNCIEDDAYIVFTESTNTDLPGVDFYQNEYDFSVVVYEKEYISSVITQSSLTEDFLAGNSLIGNNATNSTLFCKINIQNHFYEDNLVNYDYFNDLVTKEYNIRND